MTLIIIVIIIVIIYYFYKSAKQNNPQRIIEDYENTAKAFLGSIKSKDKSIYGREDFEENILKMREWYVRLKEKYKHDNAKLIEIARDWKDYTYNQSSKSTNVYLWMEEEDEESAKELDQETKDNIFVIQEIENRFASMLGEDYQKELKDLRAKMVNEDDLMTNL